MIPTSNHNKPNDDSWTTPVVYLLIPTSNHNLQQPLQLVYQLYIFWFLHQTTTLYSTMKKIICCISFDSYIKPQLIPITTHNNTVVYLLIPTSNHNSEALYNEGLRLYIFWFLHHTTTPLPSFYIPEGCISFDSYIKPQLKINYCPPPFGCISFDSYIKPQPRTYLSPYPQSCISFDSYIKPQPFLHPYSLVLVVYLLIPTSNHNHLRRNTDAYLLYIFWFLHQTTTYLLYIALYLGCISFDSYIKPQPC